MKMWTEAALCLSAVAEASDPSFAEFQYLDAASVDAKKNQTGTCLQASSNSPCGPSIASQSSTLSCPPSSSPSPSFSSPLSPKGNKRSFQGDSSSNIRQPHLCSRSTSHAEHQPRPHRSTKNGLGAPVSTPLRSPASTVSQDGIYSDEERLGKLLLERRNAADNFEPRAAGWHGKTVPCCQVSEPDSEGGIMIFPSPECVLKSKLEGGEKIFINLCTHDRIGRWHNKQVLLENENQGESREGLRIPLSVGEKTECNDKTGAPALAVDVVFHTETLRDCLKHTQLRQLLAQFAMAAVSHKYNIKLQEHFSFPRLKYKNRGAHPPPQRIKAVKTPEIQQISSSPSSHADANSPDQSTALSTRSSTSRDSLAGVSPEPTFECWYLRPSRLRTFVSFLRENLRQELAATSVYHGDPPTANSGPAHLRPYASSGASAEDEPFGICYSFNQSDPYSGQEEENAACRRPFLSLWLAAACTDEAGVFEDTADLEERGAINAFDFDRVASKENVASHKNAVAHVPSEPVPVKNTKVSSHEGKTQSNQPLLPMKRAFLLSPEEKRKHEQVTVSKTSLCGTIFILQLDMRTVVENSVEQTVSSTPVRHHDSPVPTTKAGLDRNRSPCVKALSQPTDSRTSDLCTATRSDNPATGVLTAAALHQEAADSFQSSKVHDRGADHACDVWPSTSKARTDVTASSAVPNSAPPPKQKTASYQHAAYPLPLVEISDNHIFVGFSNNINTPSPETHSEISFSEDATSSRSSGPSSTSVSSSSAATRQLKFLYVFPFDFRSNFAYAFLLPGNLLTVLVPTDLSAAAVLEEELSCLTTFSRPEESVSVEGTPSAGAPSTVGQAQRSAPSRHESSCAPDTDSAPGTAAHTETRLCERSESGAVATASHPVSSLQACKGSFRGFANETLDEVF